MAKKQYTWDPVTDSTLEETDGLGSVLASYTNEPSAYGPLVSQHSDGESHYFHFDVLGSTRELTNDEESAVDTFSYDAWGGEIKHTGITPMPYAWGGAMGVQALPKHNSYVLYSNMDLSIIKCKMVE